MTFLFLEHSLRMKAKAGRAYPNSVTELFLAKEKVPEQRFAFTVFE